MGNDICCQQTILQEFKQQAIYNPTGSHTSEQKITPKDQHSQKLYYQLSSKIREVLEQHKPFEAEFNQQQEIKIKRYGNDHYEGPIDIIGRPCKIGKMYKENGAFFIGNFASGKAQGPCMYVMKDGSYYKGLMKDNHAKCDEGEFVSKDYQYFGSFQNNAFHGKGKQTSPSYNYSFEGIFENGKKKIGIMRWIEKHHQNVYEGAFDENGKYTGKGRLIDSEGIYDGEFVNGQRHGFGIYFYKTQLRYEGFYAHNKKEGQGKLFNNDNSIAYKGVFKNGMPNGKGIATTKNGTQFHTQWIDGIDARLL